MRFAVASSRLLLCLGLTGLGLAGAARTAAAEQEAPATEGDSPSSDKAEKQLQGGAPSEKVEVRSEKKDEEGVKTYKFGAVEVEGRLKAPQILYFLRRVRAEFRAGLLGHRSFMPELQHTRHHPALR